MSPARWTALAFTCAALIGALLWFRAEASDANEPVLSPAVASDSPSRASAGGRGSSAAGASGLASRDREGEADGLREPRVRPSGDHNFPSPCRPDSSSGNNTSSGETASAEDDGRKDEQSTASSGRARLTPEQEAVVVLYEDMAKLFELHDSNCDRLAVEVENLVEDRSDAVSKWSSRQASLTPAERKAEQEQIESSAYERLATVRGGMRSAVARCSSNQRLLESLRRLSAFAPVN